MLTRLTFEKIGDLDGGRAKAAINDCLATIYKDLEERGHDNRARVLKLNVTFLSKDGLTVIDVQASPALPPYRTNLTAATMHTKHGVPELFFQEHNPENPAQETFPEMDKAEGEIDA